MKKDESVIDKGLEKNQEKNGGCREYLRLWRIR